MSGKELKTVLEELIAALDRRNRESNTPPRRASRMIRFRALTASCECIDVAQSLRAEPSHAHHACELAASFDLNEAWEFDAERFRSAVESVVR